MSITKDNLTSLLLAVIAFLLVAAALPSRASAGSPYLWDKRTTVGVVPVRGMPTTYNNIPTWFTEGTTFIMYCWTYGQTYTGNWTTNIWFWGQATNTRMGKIGYAHGSHVYNQVWVPRCR